MFSRHKLVFKTIGGTVVWPSQAEADRIANANQKYAKQADTRYLKLAWDWGKRLGKKYPKVKF